MPMVDHASQLCSLPREQPIVMGILNATPDSFSDGGNWGTVDRAVAQAEKMLSDGAHIIDIGGESSRPGAQTVAESVEIERVLPIIDRLAGRCIISIDTAKPEVASAALTAGASIINDITASLEVVAGDHGAGWIAMHMQGEPGTMQQNPTYDNVVTDVAHALSEYRTRAGAAGVEHLWVDPGFGFGKTTDHNLALLRDLDLLSASVPLVVGVSRKRFIGEVLSKSDGSTSQSGRSLPFSTRGDKTGRDVEVSDRVEGSVMAAVWSWGRQANIVRAHDVRATALAAQFFTRQKRK